MNITEVQVKIIGNGDERLKASCTLVIDGEFVIRDVKVIDGTSGMFVAMPSRKLTDHCPKCSSKNHLRALFCNNCGAKLAENRTPPRGDAQQMHIEIAHPINSDCRKRLHEAVIGAYENALAQRKGADQDHGESARDPRTNENTAQPQPAMAESRSAEERASNDFGSGL